MRKYRGISTYSDENWIYGYYVSKQQPCGKIDAIIHDGRNENRVILDSVSQSTGLFDKNGKEIFEGDIVEVADTGVRVKGIMSIAFEKGAFRLYPNYSNASIAFPNEIEVIGNIHENEELLK